MRVWNARDPNRKGTLIDRSTKWGNPFIIGRDGSREDVIRKYESYARVNFTEEELLELKGHDLICWCSPLPCHGDVLVRLMEEITEEEGWL